MNTRHPRAGGRAFALLELSAAIVLVVVAVVLSSIVIPDARRRARLAGSIQNLRQLGAAAGAYARDNDNAVFSFTWEPGEHSCGDYAFPTSTTYNDAADDQAVCILRERGHRTDISWIRAWVPYVWYSHLVLAEYLDMDLPSPVLVSPGDAPRLAWFRATVDHPGDSGQAYFGLTCRPAGTGNDYKRWPYSSSYEMQPSFVSPDAQINTPQGPIPTLAQNAMGHRYYDVGNSRTVLGRRRMDEVWYPSNKAMMYETNERFFGARELFFMYPDARVPVLLADASASVRSMERANHGFYPNTPNVPTPTRVNYVPELAWESPTRSGSATEFVFGRTRWTRSGLRGRDFQGPEVPWVP